MDTKPRSLYMLPARYSHEVEIHTQMECEGMEEDIPCHWKTKDG